MDTVDNWVSSTKKNYKDEVVELDQLKVPKITPAIKEEFEKFKSLKKISMNGCDLRSLDNFPNIPSLEELFLTDNKIKGEELAKLPALPNLKCLDLSSNPIYNVQDLKPLTKYNRTIERLSLQGCNVTKNDSYRQEIFQLIGGTLAVIDLEDRQGKQVAEQQEMSDDEDDDQDDVEGGLIQDDEEQQPLPGKRKAPTSGRPTGKQQESDDEEDDDDEDDDQDADDDEGDDDELSGDEDEDQQSSEKDPKKKVKRS